MGLPVLSIRPATGAGATYTLLSALTSTFYIDVSAGNVTSSFGPGVIFTVAGTTGLYAGPNDDGVFTSTGTTFDVFGNTNVTVANTLNGSTGGTITITGGGADALAYPPERSKKAPLTIWS